MEGRRSRRNTISTSPSILQSTKTYYYGSITPENVDSSGLDGEKARLLRKDVSRVVDETKLSPDEFEEQENINNEIANKITRTGRQRKKLAARTKGGEFQARRKKRRVYFCCVSSEIDLEKLQEAIVEYYKSKTSKLCETKMYEDVLHVHVCGDDVPVAQPVVSAEQPVSPIKRTPSRSELIIASRDEITGMNGYETEDQLKRLNSTDSVDNRTIQSKSSGHIWAAGSKELFVFEFGVAVFWGYTRAEEEDLVMLVREFVEQGLLSPEECTLGQDDMAFITSSEAEQIEIANDVITLPDGSGPKIRLSASFAIAQSAVMNVLEARIESLVKDYKYIPETLALTGRLKLSPKMLNKMIGEVYRIRHDVNLHTEILDTPDFFWKEEKQCEDVYHLISLYLEMSARTEVLNKRLDMLRELLGVLQQQQENSSAMKLEWIVIWLIVISVVVESVAIAVEIMKP